MSENSSEHYPFKHAEARRMLKAALRASNGLNQQELAKRLGYTSAVTMSHMASGRAPIPFNRVLALLKELGMTSSVFFLAVLDQRLPELMQLLKPSGLASDVEANEIHQIV
jgi:transcriptional regulator with XRE-family HTH domain